MPDTVAEKRYRELVRLAYLILPGDGSPEVRLVLARRIVDRNLPRRPVSGRAYTEIRERVLRQAMTPPRRTRYRLVPKKAPAKAPLAVLAPDERVAYVLRRVAGLRHHVVRDLLVDLGVADPQGLLTRVEEMPELGAAAPAVVCRRHRFRRSRLPLLAAAAVTCALVAAVEVDGDGHSSATVGATGDSRPSAAPSAVPKAVPPTEAVYWRGRLPAGGGPAELRCRTEKGPDGTARGEGVFVRKKVRSAARDCADGRTGVWWRAPSGRWYYLAAAAPGVRLPAAGIAHPGRLRFFKGGTGPTAPAGEPVLVSP